MAQTPRRPIPWSQAQTQTLSRVKGVCLDIDDTLSTHGKLKPDAYAALWRLKEAGYAVVPVTGRPAGWCDLISRFWPVDAVVGENGAFTFFMQDGVRKRINTPGAVADPKPRLGELGQKIRARFPHALWASDQSYREYDLAIDFCEDVKPWPKSDVAELVRVCEAAGAHAKVSSIHVNAWFGDYDKKSGLKYWLDQGAPGLARPGEPAPGWNEWLFIGDSPNDEPLFGAFDLSVGVSNLNAFIDQLKTPPTWITSAASGSGFVEMADRLVALKLSDKSR